MHIAAQEELQSYRFGRVILVHVVYNTIVFLSFSKTRVITLLRETERDVYKFIWKEFVSGNSQHRRSGMLV